MAVNGNATHTCMSKMSFKSPLKQDVYVRISGQQGSTVLSINIVTRCMGANRVVVFNLAVKPRPPTLGQNLIPCQIY